MCSRLQAGRVQQAILFIVVAGAGVCAQETGGGSTENFKRPANPSVHHRRQATEAAAGGHTAEPAVTKQSTRNPQSTDPSVAGIEPGAAASPTAKEPSPPTTTDSGRKSRLGAFGGLKQTSPPRAASSAPKPPFAIKAISTPPGPNEAVEDAIEAGNAARDRKPPDYAGAESSYQLAAKLAPADARPYEGLGNIYLEQGLDQKAVEAYRKAVELKTTNAGVLEGLGDGYYQLGQYAESLAASTEAIRLNPDTPGPYFTRTHANLILDNGGAAGEDARAFLELWRPPWSGNPPFYIAIAGYLGYRHAGFTSKADRLLAEAVKGCAETTWVCQLVKYLNRELTAEQLLIEAVDTDKLTEAHTYIGIDLALAGRREEAVQHFVWVKENGNRRFTEYALARAWLLRLNPP